MKEEEIFAKFDANARCGCAVQPGAKPDCRQAGFMRHMGVFTTSNVHLLEPALWGGGSRRFGAGNPAVAVSPSTKQLSASPRARSLVVPTAVVP